MRLAVLILAFAIAAIAIVIGVDRMQGSASACSPGIETGTDSAAAVARRLYPRLLLAATGQPLSDRAAFLAMHREEIERTLDVSGVLGADSVSVALLRYSIGPDVYRDVLWLRRVGGEWRHVSMPRFAADTADPFADGQPDRSREIVRRADVWLAEGAPRWW